VRALHHERHEEVAAHVVNIAREAQAGGKQPTVDGGTWSGCRPS
jgi:hypothetical protein